MFLWRHTTNSTIEVRGRENIPEGGFVVASKHQSAWETIAFGTLLDKIVFIMKQELMYLPIFGWYTWRTGMIPIKRHEKGKVVGPMTAAAKKAVDKGHRIIIFMEGTRVAAGQKGRYRTGAARLSQSLDCAIVPVALNAGLFWPRNSFWRYSGNLIVEFLPPIPAGKPVGEIMKTLERDVEEASNRLLLETAATPNPPPTIHAALDELEKRGVDISSVRAPAST
ncbi:MAG: lysophospholipid acyltransferase family protein [Hyphomicrobiales bacterium]